MMVLVHFGVVLVLFGGRAYIALGAKCGFWWIFASVGAVWWMSSRPSGSVSQRHRPLVSDFTI